jgi:branched-chain amino acid transport system substrate-binding protein
MTRRNWPVMLAVGVMAAWPWAASSAPAVRLGAHAPETGSLAKHGIEQVKGIRLAAEEFQKRHGVQVELLVYDDESQPQKAVAAVEKLAGVDKVNGIVGGYGSNLVGPASEAAERYDIPYMTTGAVDTKLSAKGFKNFFRLNYMPGYAAAQSATIKELFQAKKVAILYNSQSATTEIAEEVRRQLSATGVAVPVFEKFEKGTTNYKPLLLKAKDAGCEVLLVEGYFPDYVGTIKDARILALPVKAYVGAWGIGTPEFVRELGPMSEYVYGTSIWEMGTAPQAARAEEAQFIAAYRARFHEDPSYIAMLGYLSAQCVLDAIVKGGGSGAYAAEKTRQVLRAMDAVTPIGRVAFDERGDPKHFSAVLFQSRGGKQVVVYPRDRATGSPTYPAVPWSEK